MKQSLTTIKTEEEFFLGVSRTFQLMRKHAERLLQPTGVTLSEYTLMRIVDATPSVTAREICDILYATAPTIAHTIASLERKKLITRTTDTKDARRQHIKLTAAGRKIVTKGKKDINAFAQTLEIKPSFFASAGKVFDDFQKKLEKVRG
jgi:DNA-binding MarR family transcriptional regulator